MLHFSPPKSRSPSFTASKTSRDLCGSRKCRFLARVIYTRHGCRGIQEFTVEVCEISPTEIAVRSPLAPLLPDDFTLVIGARQYGFGCAVYARKDKTVRCRLIRQEKNDIIDFLATVPSPADTLSTLRNPLFPKSRADIAIS